MAARENAPTAADEIGKTDQTDGSDNKCVFCKIVNGEMGTELLYNDEDVCCFRDIHPGAPHHYLVVPTRHVGNCKSLGREHIPLVEKMVETGKDILQKNCVTDFNDVRFGFHWPRSALSHTCIFMYLHPPVRWASCPAWSTGLIPIGSSRQTRCSKKLNSMG